MRPRGSWVPLFPCKPVVVSEFGHIGLRGFHGEHHGTEEHQVEEVERHWKRIVDTPSIRGALLWIYNDYLWCQHKHPKPAIMRHAINSCERSFGVVDRYRKRKVLHAVTRRLFAGVKP